jgi:ubiquinone biosynthesis protein UbiJ
MPIPRMLRGRHEIYEADPTYTLQRYAAALGCGLTYALVPKRPLQEVVEERAERIARDEASRVKHSMALEDQSTDLEHLEREIAELRRKLMEGKRSRLWQ